MNKNLEETENVIIKDLAISQIIPNLVDDVVVGIFEGKVESYLPRTMSGDKYRRWYLGKGGIFYKDVKNFNNNKSAGQYVLISNNESKFIARLIEEHEFDMFKLRNIIDGTIKDKQYMIVRHLDEDENLIKTARYIKEFDEDFSTDFKIIITDNIPSSEATTVLGNFTLFEN
jgi:hypothetical protein